MVAKDDADQFSGYTIDRLKQELLKSRELLKAIGAYYYALALLKGDLPNATLIPTVWMQQAYLLMEGDMLEGVEVGKYDNIGSLDSVYESLFTDATGERWEFFFDKLTQQGQLRTNSKLRPFCAGAEDVTLWIQALQKSCGFSTKEAESLIIEQEKKGDGPYA